MAVTTRRREQRDESLQPALFRPEALTLPARHTDDPRGPRPLPQDSLTQPAPTRHSRESGSPLPSTGEASRPTRLFSLTQRSNMRGVHERQSAPAPGKRYAASIVVSRSGSPGGATTATVTIGELPGHGGPLLVVHHERDAVNGRLALTGLIASVERTWGCHAVVSDGPEAQEGLAEALRTAAGNGGVHVYQPDGSREQRDFDAQVVGARARLGTGGFALDNGPRDDAYVVGLGLLLRAAERVAPPMRRAA